jgi:hypothetical protein
MTDHIRTEIAAWVDSEYGNCPVSASELLALIDAQATEIKQLRAELAKPEQEESFIPNWANYRQGVADGKAGNPKWHDAPTCDGLWVCSEGDDNPYRWTTHRVKFPISPLLVGEDERWYGPIPQDGGKS